MKKGLGYLKMNHWSVDNKCGVILYCCCRCSSPMLGHNLPSLSRVPTSSKFLHFQTEAGGSLPFLGHLLHPRTVSGAYLTLAVIFEVKSIIPSPR